MKNTSKLLACALLFSAACGDDDKNSGVSQSKKLSDVTAAEATDLCQWQLKQLASTAPTDTQACTFIAQLSSQNQSACEALRDQCLKAEDEPNGGDNAEAEDPCAEVDTADLNCDAATVGDYQNCVKAMSHAVHSSYAAASCKNAGEIGQNFSIPEACKTLDEKCPGILDTIGFTDNGENS